MTAFRDVHLSGRAGASDEPISVLDLGSMAYAAQNSYRPIFAEPPFVYSGLDVTAGPNVDIVVADPHCWSEVASASFDVVISGQALEHDAQFWVTLAEVSRVLRPGGWCCIVAPASGPPHRYPVDCWRFYPDAGAALMEWAGLDLVEAYVEVDTRHKGQGIEWQDMLVIGRKPEMDDAEHARHLERLATIVSLRTPVAAGRTRGEVRGPAVERYEQISRVPLLQRRPFALRAWAARTRFAVWSRLPANVQTRIETFRNRRQSEVAR
jgi:SAM-dependent methyltransferase